MNRLRFFALGTILTAATAGCAGLSPPNWFHPGSAREQQARAQRFDPYPQSEGGPSVAGVRPRDYDKPIPEVDRARWNQSQACRNDWNP